MSSAKYVRPLCFGTSGSVRATSIPRWAMCASVFQTFWPFTTHSSPSRTARVASEARSDPAPGSLKSWHQISSPVKSGRSNRAAVSGSAWPTIVGAARKRPKPFQPTSSNTMPAARMRAVDDPLERRVDAEPTEAGGEVHPSEPEVVLGAAERDPIGRIVLGQQLLGERFDLGRIRISHGRSVGRSGHAVRMPERPRKA